MNKIVYLRHKPFDEVDATQQGTWIESYFANFINSINTSGIVSGLAATFTSGMSVSISAGTAYDTNYALINVGSPVVKTLSVGDAANPRIDLISIKYATNTTNNTDTTNKYGFGTSYIYSQNSLDSFTITVTQGTPAGSPTTPATPAGNLALASILVPANATVIIPGNITDLRVLIQLKQTISAANISPNTITDSMIGNRTVNDSVTADTGAQTLVNNLSMLGNIIKQITGKAAWYTSPVTTLETLNTNKANLAAPSFTGTVNSAGIVNVNAGAATLTLNAGSADHVYMTFFARTATPAVRSGFIGFSSAATINMSLTNEITNGSIILTPNGTGTVQIPTATADTNNVTAASTAFVIGQASSTAPIIDGVATVGTSLRYARADHVHPTDGSRAPTVSPTFTGNVIVPNQTAGDNSTKAANTAFIAAAIAAIPPVNAATASALGTVQVSAMPASGNPIAPSKVKEAKNVSIATTGANVLATFTPAVSGNFEIPIRFRVITGTTNVTITISYTDGTGAITDTVLNAQSCTVGSYNTVPWYIYAVSGAAITVTITASVANQVSASTSIVGV